MSTQPVEANVVLTADNAQYDQAMMASAGSTNDLGKAVDQLGQKISSITKSAGKGLVGIAAADVAMITAATAAWASYEKQVSRLNAQSAILARNSTQQSRMMGDYTKAVSNLRSTYGTTTAEASKLVETLSKVTNVRQSRQLGDLSKIFTDMSKATGESSAGLAASVLNLQKVMGSEINPATSKKYADMFTYLGAQTNTSTQGLVDFTAQLAPMGEAMGLNGKQVAGFATAFARAGQEGIGASTVFNKVAGDITQAIATGSPEIKQYANLIGVTSEKFKQMDEGEALVQIFEALHAQGGQAIATLQRWGLEGPRTMKAVNAVINEPGGVRGALRLSEIGAESDAAATGAAAAMEGITDEFGKLRSEIEKTAESMATIFGPAVEKFVWGMTKAMDILNDVTQGPFGEFVQLIMATVAPLAAGVGGLLLFAGTLLKVAAAYTLLRNSASRGAIEGFKGGSGMTRMPDGSYVARGSGVLGPQGAQIAEGQRWTQAGLYNIGQPIGAGAAGALGGIREAWMSGRERFDPNYQRPTTSRGPLSYLAGGFGRGMEMFVNPQFDQMRYKDPSKRDPFFGRFASGAGPLARARDFFMGSGAAADPNAEAMRSRLGQMFPMGMSGLTDFYKEGGQGSSRAEQMADVVKNIKTETESRIASNQATQENITSTRAQTDEIRKNTTGWARARQGAAGFGMGALGATWGGIRSGADIARRSPLALPAGGVIGAAGLSALGVESNALMFGAMGASLGTPQAAVGGAALGLLMDVNAGDRGVKQRTGLAQASLESGALADIGSQLKGVNEDADKFREFQEEGWWEKPIVSLTGPSLLGESGIPFLGEDEKYEKAAATREEIELTGDALRSLGEAQGVTISDDTNKQWAQFEQILVDTQPAMDQLGITLDEMREAKEEGGQTWANMLADLNAPGEATGLWDRLRAGGGVGRTMVGTVLGQTSLRQEGNIPLAFEAVNEFYDTAISQGRTNLQIWRQAERAQRTVGDDQAPEYIRAEAVAQKAAQALALKAPQLGRVGAFQQQLQVGQMFLGLPTEGLTGKDAAEIEEQKAATVSAVGDQISYFRQMLHAQDQYDLQRERAQEDYHEQRTYQEYDYQLQRERAEENFNRMRGRATADFQRGQTRAHYDFNLSRQRAEEDFNHQVEIMAKQAAMSVYDIYARVQTQRTSSAEWLLTNAQDQLNRMEEQTENLRRLRRMGLTDSAIQQMKLTDPQNAQQLARFVTEMTPQMIRQFNRVAGAERQKAAKDIVTDPSSLEWQEMRRSFRLNMRRGADDFERQMKLSRQDFRRGLRQQKEDFNISMEDQAEDYRTGVNRQEKAFKKSMDRSAEDMANMSNEVLMSVEDVLTESQARLTGAAGRQARQVAASLRELKQSTKPEAVALMKDLAAIYGFEYKVPTSVTNRERPAGVDPRHLEQGNSAGRAEGGVIPGWSPGRDDRMVPLSGGEAIMRPEWARAVGEKNVEAMNHRARYGGYFLGGVMPLEAGTASPNHSGSHASGYSGIDYVSDINSPFDLRSPPAKVMAWKAGRVADVTHLTTSYGKHVEINHPGGQHSLYAHLSSIVAKIGDAVSEGQMLGRVGETGRAYGAHLHFEIDGGHIALGDASGQGGDAGGGVSRAAAMNLLKRRYPEAEAAARAMIGVHPLWPGDISEIINRNARRKINQLDRRYGAAGPAGYDTLGVPEGASYGPNATGVWNALMAAGYSKIQAAGIMGNMQSESGFNPFIVQGGGTSMNPAAAGSGGYGLVQWTPGAKLIPYLHGKPPSVASEIQALSEQLAGKGGSPEASAGASLRAANTIRQATLAFELEYERHAGAAQPNRITQAQAIYKKYAADGMIVDGSQQLTVGEEGPEAVIPLNARGADFMADVMGSVMGGRNTARMQNGVSVYNTKVDRSTNFTGPITVQANDPMELIGKLKARQRVMALSRPSLTGSAA